MGINLWRLDQAAAKAMKAIKNLYPQ